MIRPVLTYPQDKEILTKESCIVEDVKSEKVQTIIQDLKDTLLKSNGAGISAIQIGEPLQICVINWDGLHVLINPEVIRTRGEYTLREGCLSVPGLWIETPRYQKVWIKALDENGNEIEYAEGGNGSYIAQHELDHFKGTCTLFAAYDEVAAQLEEAKNEQD
jgi:peptide deformylase